MEDKTYVKTDSEEYITHNTLKEIEKRQIYLGFIEVI